MSGYTPFTGQLILGRPKVKYYGAYPCGFLLRARDLLGIHWEEPLLHVCAGKVKAYSDPAHGVQPGVAVRGWGPNDKTLDIDPALEPDYCQDARESLPELCFTNGSRFGLLWPAILIDPPYTEEDATHYACGSDVFPDAGALLKNALAAVRPWGRVGMLHYLWPRPPKGVRCVAKISVSTGFGNRDRCYSVFERPGKAGAR